MIACNDLRGLEWGVVGVVWWVWWIAMLHYATAYANTTPILQSEHVYKNIETRTLTLRCRKLTNTTRT